MERLHGESKFVRSCVPSWPNESSPQAHTVPSDLRAMLWEAPAAMATTPLSPCTCVGTALTPFGWFVQVAKAGFPSAPEALMPQAQTVPSDFNARLWS